MKLPDIGPVSEGKTHVSIRFQSFDVPAKAVGMFVQGALFSDADGAVEIGDAGPEVVVMCAGQHLQHIVDALRKCAEEIGVTIF